MSKTIEDFRITQGKGFQITFKNRVVVSVQFGYGSHCRDYPSEDWDSKKISNIIYSSEYGYINEANAESGARGSPNAEIAIYKITKKGERNWLTKKWKRGLGDDVSGYQTPKNVLSAMIWAEKYDK